jgi:tRNA(Ile)-lysidine synthase
LLFINGELIAVAGIGISYPHLIQVGPRLMPEWG